MMDTLVAQAAALGPQWGTVLLAALPLSELRGSIPVAIGLFQLGPVEAFLWSILGNAIPMVLLGFGLDPMADWLGKRSQRFQTWHTEWITQLETKHKKRHEKYGYWALLVFVAIPLPGSGVWMGSLLGSVFHIPIWKRFVALVLGMIIAGVLMTLAVAGVVEGLKIFL